MEGRLSLIEHLRTGDLFAGLSDPLLEKIAALCQEQVHSAGRVLFSEGDPAQWLYILQEGIVIIRIQPAPGGKSIVVQPIEKKSGVFGWSALVEPHAYTAAAVCTTDVKLIAIDGKKLMALLEESPSVGLVVMRRLASIISSRLRRAWEHLKEDVYLGDYRF
jgi:CRP-like cAMP-binding protein